MTLDCEVVTTESGALALRDRRTGELMHPVVGPLVEANALYVVPSRLAARLSSPLDDPLVLLDVGLGAGSNAVAALGLSETFPETARRLEIVSFDRSLAALELALSPPHASAFGLGGNAGVAARRLLVEGRHASARTTWRFVDGELPATLSGEASRSADVVFWDPFSPRSNPTLWTVCAFAALRRLCRDGATVHTYSSATSTRSALLLAGFAVGVGGAVRAGHESTVAAVRVEDLAQPLGKRWLERLARSSAAFPPDASGDALERVAEMPQFRVT